MTASSSSSSEDLQRSLTIRKSEISEYVDGRTQGYSIRLEVLEARFIPAEIFVYQRKPGTLPGSTPIDVFSNVASPADLEEYAAGEPAADSAFFRLHYVDLVYRNLDLLHTSIDELIQDIRCLLESLGKMDLLVEESITITGDYVPFQASLTVIKVVASTSNPTVNDDISEGYSIGSWWVNISTGDTLILTDNTEGAAQWISVSGGSLVSTNKDMPALATSADGALATNTAIVTSPFQSSYIIVTVNNHGASLGDGVKTKDCYFSRDGGATALLVQNLQVGDKLYWNGSIAGYQLEIDDTITFNYTG